MRLLFAGTPDIAVPSLELLAKRHDVAGVLTAPDRSAGRGRVLKSPPVKITAERLQIPVLQPGRLDQEVRSSVAALGADLMVVFAYGRIFGPKFLALFPSGAINLHPSALPAYRGPSPLTAAILDGLEKTGLTVQMISPEMDAGDILKQIDYQLTGLETTGSLTAAVARDAAPFLADTVDELELGGLTAIPQDPVKASWCRLTRREDGEIDWRERAVVIERKVRAFQPWPVARTTFNGESLAILEAGVEPGLSVASPGTVLGVDKSRGILLQTGDGVLAVRRLQLAARKPLDFRSFLNGVDMKEHTILGDRS